MQRIGNPMAGMPSQRSNTCQQHSQIPVSSKTPNKTKSQGQNCLQGYIVSQNDNTGATSIARITCQD